MTSTSSLKHSSSDLTTLRDAPLTPDRWCGWTWIPDPSVFGESSQALVSSTQNRPVKPLPKPRQSSEVPVTPARSSATWGKYTTPRSTMRKRPISDRRAMDELMLCVQHSARKRASASKPPVSDDFDADGRRGASRAQVGSPTLNAKSALRQAHAGPREEQARPTEARRTPHSPDASSSVFGELDERLGALAPKRRLPLAELVSHTAGSEQTGSAKSRSQSTSPSLGFGTVNQNRDPPHPKAESVKANQKTGTPPFRGVRVGREVVAPIDQLAERQEKLQDGLDVSYSRGPRYNG
jgi:hypothetical protein